MKRRAVRLRIAGVAAAAALVAAGVAGSALAVQNGTPDPGHPYVGAVVWNFIAPDGSRNSSLCSGSLVSPTVFVTAAHCFPGYGHWPGFLVGVSFDSQVSPSLPNVWHSGTVYIDPNWCAGCAKGLAHYDTNDIAVVQLDDPVTLPAYAQMPSLGYDDTLPNNQRVDVVGYGLQNVVPPGIGVKLVGSSKIVPGGGATGDQFLKISSSPGQGAAICSGDSGGPNLQTGTDLMLATSTYGPNDTCHAVAYSQRMDTFEALGFVGSFPR